MYSNKFKPTIENYQLLLNESKDIHWNLHIYIARLLIRLEIFLLKRKNK